MLNKKLLLITTVLISGSLITPLMARPVTLSNVRTQAKKSKINTIIKELSMQNSNLSDIEFASTKNGLHYFRLYSSSNSMDYTITECYFSNEDNSTRFKELTWIWAKDYQQNVKHITFKRDSETNCITAQVYLEDGTTLEEKVIFKDPNTKYYFVY